MKIMLKKEMFPCLKIVLFEFAFNRFYVKNLRVFFLTYFDINSCI